MQSHISMSILLSIFHVQLLCYGNRGRLAMGWLLTADFRSFSLFSPAVLLLALNALLTHSCLLIPSQSLRGVHSMISVIIPCLLALRPTVIPSVLLHFFPSSFLALPTVCLRKCNCCGGPGWEEIEDTATLRLSWICIPVALVWLWCQWSFNLLLPLCFQWLH